MCAQERDSVYVHNEVLEVGIICTQQRVIMYLSYAHSYPLSGHGITAPNPSLTRELITDAFIISIISFVINISQAKLLAKKNSYTVHPDQVTYNH